MNILTKKRLFMIFITSMISGLFFLIAVPFVDNHSTLNVRFGGFFIGFFSIFSILTYEYFISSRFFKKFNTLLLIILNSTTYLIIIIAIIIIATLLFKLSYDEKFSFADVFSRSDFQIGVLISFIAILSIQFAGMINALLGKNVLFNIITARYHKPHEVDKIVMFLDIKGSTAIAEKIGHGKFLSLLNDFFFDISEATLITKGEIYKYVGDEAIVLWNIKDGVKNNNCIRFFHLIKEKIQKNKEKYLKKYGIIPEFKAGIHCGRIIVGEMGLLKKEIAYIGDVLNTTARIESMCKDLRASFISSKDLIDLLHDKERLDIKSAGLFNLRGKENEQELFIIN
jgi:adenylate cyclase